MSSLDYFVQLPENRSAYAAMKRLGSGANLPLLVLHGPPGSGKSHLVQSFAVHVTQSDPAKTIQVHPAAELGRALLRPALERREVSRDAIACDLLVIEDLQHLPVAAGDAIAHILDRRQARRRPTVVTAVRGPADIETSPRLASRLTGGLVVAIQPLSESSRRLLATSLCRERDLQVDDDVIAWLARDPGGARPILGSIARLEVLAQKHPPPLTLAQVTKGLPATFEPSSPLYRFAAAVASRFHIDTRSLRGPSRSKNIAWPRQVAMYVARQAGYSFPQIGAYFGNRDHTTAMHSCDKVTRLIANDVALAQEIRDLQTAIGQP